MVRKISLFFLNTICTMHDAHGKSVKSFDVTYLKISVILLKYFKKRQHTVHTN